MSLMNKFTGYKWFIPMYLRVRWEKHLWQALAIELIGYIFMPLICLFIRKEVRIDTMKRRAKDRGDPEYTQYTEVRDYLPKWFNWFQTHDNAMDEFWYGGYEDWLNDKFTQETYDKSWLLRYYNRIIWGWRNNSYGYQYFNLGVPEESESIKVFEDGFENSGNPWIRIEVYNNYFLYESQIPNGKGGYKSYKFGWKSHRSAPLINGSKNVMYANRIITTTRKYK
jgi:hypothetical protein